MKIFTIGFKSLGGQDQHKKHLASQKRKTQWQNEQTQSRDCDVFNTVQRACYMYVMEKVDFNALSS